MYPQAEIAGALLDCLDPDTFKYRSSQPKSRLKASARKVDCGFRGKADANTKSLDHRTGYDIRSDDLVVEADRALLFWRPDHEQHD
ncbi:hypothetical protein [Bosea sp. LC85]|uniref:hypothetical protein n=1 Tax=Bosea sp. LC85 TaxID=1502851 RepID=UPI00139F2A3E|nr:hypothetical protein [Bosea sp. LC85]